ncbi:hypothetical protein HBH71_168750 [Parastagonospora nodorum]|nr:hypothetical protein HBH52_224130 [Parastagonospora nodorum]KAH5110786.1 hypothetical protein HBH71_168750 [Parastagonospora nodorum]KAH5246037.1 hypothetical protein HBI71_184270 [Parastagonospora nodorum]KAH5672799.1 hypothetical protein HBI21_160550 [Parastagonospora nodorum]KAH5716004.1 hypothetical protein HBI20_137880 [Parastagonospora nodorum]
MSNTKIITTTKLSEPEIHNIYDLATGTWQYIVADPSTLHAIIIDSVLDFDPTTRSISTQTADSLLTLIAVHNYTIDKILETHIHADHLTAASYLQNRLAEKQGFRSRIGIGKRITQVQELFAKRYGIARAEWEGVFDDLFEDDQEFEVGEMVVKVLHLPGHTPDHVGYVVGDNVFCGDSVFHPSIGTARCDFPGGDESQLYHSARKLLQMPEHMRIYTGHDYLSDERDTPIPWLSVRDHKEQNPWVGQAVSEQDFVAKRQERDRTLKEPRLLHDSLQVNVRAGRMAGGERTLHLPIQAGGVEEW